RRFVETGGLRGCVAPGRGAREERPRGGRLTWGGSRGERRFELPPGHVERTAGPVTQVTRVTAEALRRTEPAGSLASVASCMISWSSFRSAGTEEWVVAKEQGAKNTYGVPLERSDYLKLDKHRHHCEPEDFREWVQSGYGKGKRLAVDLFSGAGG